jgi:hypothetical protein
MLGNIFFFSFLRRTTYIYVHAWLELRSRFVMYCQAFAQKLPRTPSHYALSTVLKLFWSAFMGGQTSLDRLSLQSLCTATSPRRLAPDDLTKPGLLVQMEPDPRQVAVLELLEMQVGEKGPTTGPTSVALVRHRVYKYNGQFSFIVIILCTISYWQSSFLAIVAPAKRRTLFLLW